MVLRNTTKYAIGSLIFFLVSVSVSAVVYFLINKKGQELAAKMEVISTNRLAAEQLIDLQKVLDDTAEDREQLTGYLLTEGKTINFLNEIETLARKKGLQFSTDALEVKKLPNSQFDELELHFSAVGKRGVLINFLGIVETLPYFSHIDNLIFAAKDNKRADGNWEAKITLKVGMHTYDK